MKRVTGMILLTLAVIGCSAKETQTEVELRAYDFSYARYAELLAANVVGSRVNYAGIKAGRAGLDSLIDDLAVADLQSITSNQKLAFYCNAYNIPTIRSIVDAYPLSSIKEIDGVWDKKKWLVAGKYLTLNQIEHEILRKEFSEPKIHVAVNCASVGCPPLLPVPYYPDSIDQLLTRAARRFAASEAHNIVDARTGTARISSIFDWYGEDFIDNYYRPGRYPSLSKKQNAAISFLAAHLPEEKAAELAAIDFILSYLDYDWALNDLR